MALLVSGLISIGLLLFTNKLSGPRYAIKAGASSKTVVVYFEEYWLFGMMRFFFPFLAFGMYWTTRDLPGGGSSTLIIGLPCYVLGISGVPELFLRRRHTFKPKENTVLVEGCSLSRGRFRRVYKYEELRLNVEWRAAYRAAGHHVIFRYPDFEVSFGQAHEATDAKALLTNLAATLEIPLAPAKESSNTVTNPRTDHPHAPV